MSTTSYLTEAANIAKDSINPVNVIPALIIGTIVFIILMYIVYNISVYINDSENDQTYNSKGCLVDINGINISTPIYSRVNGSTESQIIGYDNCMTKTSPAVIYGFGMFFALGLAFLAGSGVYKAGFFLANPKLATGLYATDMLLGRKANFI
jgi:hypothetical protein